MAGEVVFDAKEWKIMLNAISGRLSNPHGVLKAAFATRGFKDVIDHFKKEKGPDGPWQPLKAATLRRRTKGARPGGGGILKDTGNLRQNFLPTNLRNSGRDAVVFFNPTPYAAAHDEGAPARGIPQREFMWLSDEAQNDMLKLILDAVVR